MKDYVSFFLKIKIQNNKHYTVEECKEINEAHQKMGFKFEIKSEDTRKNPGMKQLAKICLNSLWGKFGQRSTLDSYEFITECNRLLLQLNNNTIKTNQLHIINEQCVELRFSDDIDYNIEADYISEVTAVFTTANARLRLYSMLDWLDPSQIIYCDTDSVIFIYDEKKSDHKYPSNDTKDKPANLTFGNCLGAWENEMSGNCYINEIVVAGAKSYSYIKYDPDKKKEEIIIKQKGITLDRANTNKFTFESIKDMVLKDETIVSAKRYQFTWNQRTKDIETRYISRTVQATMDSKRNIVGDDSLPFGYDL